MIYDDDDDELYIISSLINLQTQQTNEFLLFFPHQKKKIHVMDRKLQTKLLKNVHKSAQLMRDPFRISSWTNKTSQLDKNSFTTTKTGEKFRSKVTKLSAGKTWSSIQKEWIVLKQIQVSKQREQCLCGRANLKFVTYLKNIKTNQEITSGNCCLLTLKY